MTEPSRAASARAPSERQPAVSFDRAADFYDATRALPDDVLDALTGMLAAELIDRGPCVEIGVGTGRIALPLHHRGVRLLGTDIAVAMLDRLAANAGGTAPFPVWLSDVTCLPLVGGWAGGVLASHLLHLVPRWAAAVDEAMRVLRPGGVLLADFGNPPSAPWNADTDAIFRRHGVVRNRTGASGPDEVAHHLGITPRPLHPLHLVVHRTLGQDLVDWENQIHSWTWPYTRRQLKDAGAEVRRWARAEGWPLDRDAELVRVIQWWAFDRP